MSTALNGSSEVWHFKRGDVIEKRSQGYVETKHDLACDSITFRLPRCIFMFYTHGTKIVSEYNARL